MTIAELLGMPDELENLSDEVLTSHLQQYFPKTRPLASLADEPSLLPPGFDEFLKSNAIDIAPDESGFLSLE